MYERVVAFLTSVQEFFVLNRQTPKTRKTKTRKAKTRKTKTLVFFSGEVIKFQLSFPF